MSEIKYENGWAVAIWDDGKGIRFSRGPLSNSIQMELLIGGRKSDCLESYEGIKIEELFSPQEDWDGEEIHKMWWTLLDKKSLGLMVKRLQMLIDTE